MTIIDDRSRVDNQRHRPASFAVIIAMRLIIISLAHSYLLCDSSLSHSFAVTFPSLHLTWSLPFMFSSFSLSLFLSLLASRPLSSIRPRRWVWIRRALPSPIGAATRWTSRMVTWRRGWMKRKERRWGRINGEQMRREWQGRYWCDDYRTTAMITIIVLDLNQLISHNQRRWYHPRSTHMQKCWVVVAYDPSINHNRHYSQHHFKLYSYHQHQHYHIHSFIHQSSSPPLLHYHRHSNFCLLNFGIVCSNS